MKQLFNELGSKDKNKVIAIPGDISLPELGISELDMQILINEVNIVFHSAATVKFDEPLKTSVEFNVLGTRRVIQLCHKMPQLKVSLRFLQLFQQFSKPMIYLSYRLWFMSQLHMPIVIVAKLMKSFILLLKDLNKSLMLLNGWVKISWMK